MFHPRFHRWTTLVSLAVYLAASTVGSLLHDHDAPEAEASHACHASMDVSGPGIAATDGHSHHDDCTICRFLGQRPLSAEPEQIDIVCELSCELSLAFTAQPAAPPARSAQPRAPPALG